MLSLKARWIQGHTGSSPNKNWQFLFPFVLCKLLLCKLSILKNFNLPEFLSLPHTYPQKYILKINKAFASINNAIKRINVKLTFYKTDIKDNFG